MVRRIPGLLVLLGMLVATDGRAAWVIPGNDNSGFFGVRLEVFDEDSGALVGELAREFGQPTAMANDPAGNVWIANASELRQYDGFTGDELARFPAPGSGPPEGLLFLANGELLVADSGEDIVHRVDPTSGAVLGTAIFGSAATGLTALAVGPTGDLFAADPALGRLFRFDSTSGRRLGAFPLSVTLPRGMAFGADGMLYVSSNSDDTVVRVDPATGATLSTFASGGGLDAPEGVAFGSDGHLYVASSGSDEILRFDGATGAPLGVFATGGGLATPSGITFGPDGHLYVANLGSGEIVRFDGATGASLGVFATLTTAVHRALAFASNGDLVATADTGPTQQLRRYDGATGAIEGFRSASGADGVAAVAGERVFVARTVQVDTYDVSAASGATNLGVLAGPAEPADPSHLQLGPDGFIYLTDAGDRILAYDPADFLPTGFVAEGGAVAGLRGFDFGPGGDLYVASAGTDEVFRYDGSTGAPVGAFASDPGLDAPRDVRFAPDGDLLVAGTATGVRRYDGTTGAFIDVFISPVSFYIPYFLSRSTAPEVLPGLMPVIDGTGDGTNPLVDPTDVASGPDGAVYVVGRGSQNVFRVDADGTVTLLLDAAGGGSGVPLSNPFRIAVGADGTVAVAGDNEAVHRIKPDGSVTAVRDETDGGWLGARDVAVGPTGNVYATGPWPSVWKITPDDVATQIITLTGDGQGNGLNDPTSLWVDEDEFVVVGADGSDNVFEISPTGDIELLYASPSPATITDVAKDAQGNVYVAAGTVLQLPPGGGVVSVLGGERLTVDADGDLFSRTSSGAYLRRTPGGDTTVVEAPTSPLGLIAATAEDFEADASGLLLPSLVGNVVYRVPLPPECGDGLDNDGDGLVDFPDDPGCRDVDWFEAPPCDDGLDNDLDGRIDFAGGPGGEPPDGVCKAPWELFEKSGCGLGPELAPLLALLLAGRRRTA